MASFAAACANPEVEDNNKPMMTATSTLCEQNFFIRPSCVLQSIDVPLREHCIIAESDTEGGIPIGVNDEVSFHDLDKPLVGERQNIAVKVFEGPLPSELRGKLFA